MKKITFAILAIAFIAAFNSCKEEEEIQTPDEDDWEYFMKQYDENTPRTKGTFVMFGANTYYNTGLETRTAYSGDGEYSGSVLTKERIDWVSGDLIQIFCNQAQVAKNAEYRIDDNITENNVQSVATVSLNSAQGLKWNDVANYTFQGIYPPEGTINDAYPEVTNKSNGGYSGSSLEFTTIVPANQQYNAVTKAPDMRLAGMVATTKATTTDENGDVEKGNVSLVFYPIVTTLQFDLKNVSNNHIRIESIFLDIDEELNEGRKTVAGTYKVTVPDEATVLPGVTTPDKYKCNPSYSNFIYSTDKLSVSGIKQRLNKDSEATVRVVMFALPVVFTGAKLGITMRVDNGETDPEQWDLVTRRIALNDKSVEGKPYIVFQPTHKYNFKINIPNSTVFEVKPPIYEYDVPGGAAPLNVTSYTYNAAGEKTPVAWTATRYSLDGGETWLPFGPAVLTPDAIGVLPTMLEGWDKFSFTDVEGNPTQFVTPVNGTVSYNKPPYRKLKEAAPANDVDLSMRDVNGNPTGVRNTANCYLVHARGTYKFPVVYGNGIKNDKLNPIAYMPSMDRTAQEIADSVAYVPAEGVLNKGWGGVDRVTSHFLSPFINHNGDPITSPYISGAQSAKLIWQDAKGLITEVGFDGTFVTFKVTNEMPNLVEGNALIAITDGPNGTGNILWSWHIWITEMTEATNVNATADAIGGVYTGQTQASTIMSKTLVDNAIKGVTGAKIAGVIGLCDISVGPKKITIEFVQEGTNATEYVTLTQKGRFNVNAPMYQYGRKDPLQFQKGLYEQGAYPDVTVDERRTNKTFYDIEGNIVSTYGSTTMKKASFNSGAGALKESILNPDTFNTNGSMDGKYYNLWAARLTRPGRYDALRADKTKTIYDPSPAGYRVPALADVAGWAGNNNNNRQKYPDLPYIKGRVVYNPTGHYVIVDLNENVFYPILTGRNYNGNGSYGSQDWAKTEAASWVSTPNFFTSVYTGFTDPDTPFINEERNGEFPQFNPGTYYLDRHSEDFYWYYCNNQSLNSRWKVASGSSFQIRFNVGQSWMNESGGTRGNAVNILMVKERDDDTVTNPPYVIPSDPTYE